MKNSALARHGAASSPGALESVGFEPGSGCVVGALPSSVFSPFRVAIAGHPVDPVYAGGYLDHYSGFVDVQPYRREFDTGVSGSLCF